MYVHYYPPSSKIGRKSLNEIRKYCERNKIAFESEKFSFKATTIHPDTRLSSDRGSSSEESSNSDKVYETLEYECYKSELPRTFEDTQKSKDKEKWNIAMKEELKMMETRKVWELVDPPVDKTILASKWVYNIKHDENKKTKEIQG
ncbi:hypothetical protein AVEN_80609-1 [Araneus ventricosus]|uniref:Reverse transcriptase Ty1/copia-type domain-containing protein n=1 Tax=Araneus ventricosus TaxID=182803 RepID=A0A4Y2KBG0_ARAVE|nr:hypothetical protein AVEN_80609-1 [Araneus ventricosus]